MNAQKPSPKFGWSGQSGPSLPEDDFKFDIGDIVAHKNDLMNFGTITERIVSSSGSDRLLAYRVAISAHAPGSAAGMVMVINERVLVAIDPMSSITNPQVLKP